jgi:DHA1 family bicyclomycin/chloramphenicol resistance-like MFS transporter
MTYTRTLLLLALLAAFPPITTDMYLPALPLLQADWGTDTATINLTLILFFVFFSGSVLIYGPLSDSYGRRPMLLGGIGIYIAASVSCGLATGVNGLILFRILQALGAASAAALSMAIAKDLFSAQRRQQILAHIGVIVALAPMMAPLAGGLVIKWLSWRWVFFIQAGWGLVAFAGVWRMTEPLDTKVSASLIMIAGRYLHLLKNGRYLAMTLLMALGLIPMFAFIAGSTSIYMSHYGLNAQHFGFFFGANALALMVGSYACGRLTRKINGWLLLRIGFAGMAAGGGALLGVGHLGVVPFAVAMFGITFFIGLTRPMSNNLVLEQVDHDVGTAASLLMFLYFVTGALGMAMISLDWSSRIRVIALLAGVGGAVILVALHLVALRWKEALETIR